MEAGGVVLGATQPRAFLDGGEESGDVLLPAVEHLLAAIAPGQILEVISRHPDARSDVPTWCTRTGHELLHMAMDGEGVLLWIRKGDGAGEEKVMPP